MFALFLVSVLCYVVGGSGLALLFLAPEGFYRPSNPDIGIYFLLVGLFFHAMSNALDYLKEIRDAVQKMAADKEWKNFCNGSIGPTDCFASFVSAKSKDNWTQ